MTTVASIERKYLAFIDCYILGIEILIVGFRYTLDNITVDGEPVNEDALVFFSWSADSAGGYTAATRLEPWSGYLVFIKKPATLAINTGVIE